MIFRALAVLVTISSLTSASALAQTPSSRATAQTMTLTVLSTMLADVEGIGEWGFAAVVEVDGRRWLFDTGARPETVLKNAEELRVDLASIPDVILSHHHLDHTGGLVTLRKALAARNPTALASAHVATGIFAPRRASGDAEANPMVAVKAAYEATGGRFIEHDGPVELQPGVWLTGPVPRAFPERNWSGSLKVAGPAGPVEDTLPEDQAHCTGIEALYRLRALVGLTRATAVVGAVGSGYDDAAGIRPGRIAR